jgi:hypothetical protein
MKSVPSYDEALLSLRHTLDTADQVIEGCIKAHHDKSETYDELKHSAFDELTAVIIALKGLADTIEPQLNTRPIFRLIEEFRNSYAGAGNVLIGHKNPRLKASGNPVLADSNEIASLIFIAVEIQIFLGLTPTVAEKKVAKDSGMKHDKVQRTRKRFRRQDGAQKEFILMADRLIDEAKSSDTERSYNAIISQYQLLKR